MLQLFTVTARGQGCSGTGAKRERHKEREREERSYGVHTALLLPIRQRLQAEIDIKRSSCHEML